MEITVVIAEDQTIVRQGLAMIVGGMEGVRVVAEAADGREALEACRQYHPDVVLMDIKMPRMNGVEATHAIKQAFPKIHVLILTTFDEEDFIFDALRNGAAGYLLKDATPAKIEEAIREVMRGGAVMEPMVAQKVVERLRRQKEGRREKEKRELLSRLTEREIEIVRLIGEGKSNQEIAEQLYLTQGTVKNHISSILGKLDLRDRTQIAIFALRNDLL